MNSSCVLTWINSDLYNFQENDSHLHIDRNLICSDRNYASDSNVIQNTSEVKLKHSAHCFEPNVEEKRLFPYAIRISPVSKGDEKQISITSDNAGGSSVSSKLTTPSSSFLSERCFVVSLYIETKLSHIGPVPFEIHPKMSVRLLKLQVENELGIPASSQKWILQNTLGIDNDKSLSDFGVTPTSPVFLYVDSSFDRKIDIRQLSGATQNKCSTIGGSKFESVNFSSFLDVKQPTTKSKSRRKGKNVEMGKIVDGKSSFDDLSMQMLWKHMPGTSSYVSFTEGQEVDEDCKVFSDVDVMKSDFQRNDKKVRKGSLKANVLKGRKNKAFAVSREDTGSSSGESNISYLNRNYNESSQFYLNSNVTPDFNNFAEISGCEKDIFNSLTAKEYLNSQADEQNNSKNSNDLTKKLNVRPSALIKDSSSIIEPSSTTSDRDRSKPMKSFLQQLKLKNENKQTKKITNNFKVESDIEDKGFNKNIKNSTRHGAFEVVNQEYQSYASGCDDVSGKAQEITENPSMMHDENGSNLNYSVEEIKSEEVMNTTCVKNYNILTVDGITSKSHQLIESFHPSHPLFAEISIQNDAEDISPETPSLPELTDSNNQSAYNQDDLQDENLNEEAERNYQFLLRMENLNLVRNVINFTCPVCFGEFESDQGVVLHECLHTFCQDCLKKLVEYAEEAQIKCPFRDDLYSCQSHLQQREIKALVPEDVYERYLQRSIVTAESLAEKSFHCKTPDCPGWCMFEDSINVFHCPVCSHYNCLNCMAIHEGLNCRQYQDKLMQQKKMDPDSEKTLQFLNKMIESGKAVKCPKCDLILMKKWGCDWLKCSVCLTEICWITKGPRWGPAGQGDTSAGCRCGVNGIKCHPSCTYCH